MEFEMEETHICPVIGWNIGTLPDQLGMIEFLYVTRPMQDIDKSSSTPKMAMTAPQLRELSAKLLELADAALDRENMRGKIQ
jgi:hypothetical protein